MRVSFFFVSVCLLAAGCQPAQTESPLGDYPPLRAERETVDARERAEQAKAEVEARRASETSPPTTGQMGR